MKKTIICRITTVLMIVVMSVGLLSCGSDPDEPQPPSYATLIGTWKYTSGNGYTQLTFNQDGTVFYQEYQSGRWEESGEVMTYSYNEGEKIVYLYSQGKTRPETARVIELTATTLVLQDWPNSGRCTFTRQGTSTPTLIGTWKYTSGNGYTQLTFNQDGTVFYQEYQSGRWEESGEVMTYTYKNNTLSFYSQGKTRPETASVISLTATTLVLQDWPDSGRCTFIRQ